MWKLHTSCPLASLSLVDWRSTAGLLFLRSSPWVTLSCCRMWPFGKLPAHAAGVDSQNAGGASGMGGSRAFQGNKLFCLWTIFSAGGTGECPAVRPQQLKLRRAARALCVGFCGNCTVSSTFSSCCEVAVKYGHIDQPFPPSLVPCRLATRLGAVGAVNNA